MHISRPVRASRGSSRLRKRSIATIHDTSWTGGGLTGCSGEIEVRGKTNALLSGAGGWIDTLLRTIDNISKLRRLVISRH